MGEAFGEKITQLLQHLGEGFAPCFLSVSEPRSSPARPLFAFRVEGEC